MEFTDVVEGSIITYDGSKVVIMTPTKYAFRDGPPRPNVKFQRHGIASGAIWTVGQNMGQGPGGGGGGLALYPSRLYTLILQYWPVLCNYASYGLPFITRGLLLMGAAPDQIKIIHLTFAMTSLLFLFL